MTRKIKLPKPKRPSKLRQNFIAGLVILTPLVATLLVMKWLFDFLDGILGPIFEYIFGYRILGAGFIALILLIYLTGLLAANFIGRKAMNLVRSVVERVPIFREVYNSFNQVVDSLMLSQKGAFREVVIVEFPRPGMKTIGFVTNKISDSSGNEWVNVFIPTAPNPTSGFFQMVPPESVIKTNISVEDAMKIVISAGMVCPAELELSNSEKGFASAQ